MDGKLKGNMMAIFTEDDNNNNSKNNIKKSKYKRFLRGDSDVNIDNSDADINASWKGNNDITGQRE